MALVLLSSVIFSCDSGRPGGFPDNIDIEAYRRPSSNKIPYRLAEKVGERNIPRMIELGRNLFFDPRLSQTGLMSCATCHNPAFNWTDSLKVSIENSSMRTMALFNLAWDKQFLWNGSITSLAGQAMFPLRAPLGMNSSDHMINERIGNIPYYRKELEELLSSIRKPQTEVNTISLVAPLEFYISSLISPRAPFDEWVAGDAAALTEQQKRGFRLFTGKARCAECHAGWRFSDGKTYDIGIALNTQNARSVVTPLEKSKAVGLRNISQRPPYFHNGSMATLDDVINFYNRGGDEQRPTKSDKIGKLELNEEEKTELRLFLQSLTGSLSEVPIPILPR